MQGEVKRKLYITVGIPASGKSTFAKRFAKINYAKYISSDQERERVTGSESNLSKDKIVWEMLRNDVDFSLKRCNVLFDAVNGSKKSREWLIQTAKENKASTHVLYFDTPLDVCLKRNSERGRQVPHYIIKSFLERLEIPTIDEVDSIDIIKYYD